MTETVKMLRHEEIYLRSLSYNTPSASSFGSAQHDRVKPRLLILTLLFFGFY